MISLNTFRITDNLPFQLYLLSDSRIKKLLREFEFYDVRFYREEGTKTFTVCLDYPKGNLYWFVDFKRAVENDILKQDVRYEANWKSLLAILKKTIRTEYDNLTEKLKSITPKRVVTTMGLYNLRDYQAFDLIQLLNKMDETPEYPSGLILSEPRTGKTRIALSAALHYLDPGSSVVIVMPKIAAKGWMDEIQTMNSYNRAPMSGDRFVAHLIKSTKALKADVGFVANAINVRLISYDLFKRFTYAQLRKLFTTEYSDKVMFIGDECHKLRNFKTVQSEAIFKFKDGCKKDKLKLYSIGVTGTPAVKSSTDIFGLFSLINHSKIGFHPYYKDFNQFKEYFYNCEDTSYGKICKTLKRKDELNYLVRSSSIQTKKRTLEMFENYSKVYKKCLINMDEDQAAIYESVKRDMEYKEYIDCQNGLVQLTRLQQICIDPSGLVASYAHVAPKLKWAVEFIKKNITLKGIVMCRQLQPLDTLESLLDKEGIQYARIDGSVSYGARDKMIEAFRTDENVKIFLIQLDAGKESLTVPEASYTIFLDRAYTQGFNEQAEERMTPIDGRTCTKYVLDLVMRNTVEEEIYDVLINRKEDISTINDVFKHFGKEET